ncbi:hypothetical protein HanIR_Chr17g0866451 [Helianthus annuus]|nr:hypothetical protein HanIR_Chr17g0866451 [Helianthus annuus]
MMWIPCTTYSIPKDKDRNKDDGKEINMPSNVDKESNSYHHHLIPLSSSFAFHPLHGQNSPMQPNIIYKGNYVIKNPIFANTKTERQIYTLSVWDLFPEIC